MGCPCDDFSADAYFHDIYVSTGIEQSRSRSLGHSLREMMSRIARHFHDAICQTQWSTFGSLSFLLLVICLPGTAKAGQLVVSDPVTGVEREYSVEDMRRMPVTEFSTTTPWTDGLQHFVGVPLSEFLQDVSGEYTLHLKAVNDYSVSMSAELVINSTSIIAFERNGALMTVRDKGPFWLVFPFDDDERYLTESMMSRSIWQLSRIEVQR